MRMLRNLAVVLMGAFGSAGFIAIVVLFLSLGGIALHYDLAFWVPFAKGHAVAIPWIPCLIAGLFLSQFTIPVAILTWVLSFFLV